MNQSGIKPNGFNVLILPDAVEEKTAGGIYIPDDKKTKDEFATTDGTLIAVTKAAFAHITDEEWDGTKPKPGDHVVFTKYAGFRKKGKNGKTYLLVKGEDIHATIEE
jgi:chaperonin GroES